MKFEEKISYHDPFGTPRLNKHRNNMVRVVLGKKRYTAQEVAAILQDLPYKDLEVQTR